MIDVKGRRVLLLVPPVTYRATDFVAAAKRLELDLVIGSNGACPWRQAGRADRPRRSRRQRRRLRATVGPVDAVVGVDAEMLPLAARLGTELGLCPQPGRGDCRRRRQGDPAAALGQGRRGPTAVSGRRRDCGRTAT